MQDYQQQKRTNDTSVTDIGKMTERKSAENAYLGVSCSTEAPNAAMSSITANNQLTTGREKVSDTADVPNNDELQILHTSSDVSSAQRKTWSARLRDKLEKREKETGAEQKEEVPDKRSRVEPAATAVEPSPPKPPSRRPSGGQKKNKNKSLHHHLGGSTDGSGFGGIMLGGAGARPNQSKSTAYHLTPSLLEDVLNEKKMSLMRSPEVTEHLQMLQRNVSINRLLGTAPPQAVKKEGGDGSVQVKIEASGSNMTNSSATVATIGEVMMVTIKKEGDNENHLSKTVQNETVVVQSNTGVGGVGGASHTVTPTNERGAIIPGDSQKVPSSDNTFKNALDLTATKDDAS